MAAYEDDGPIPYRVRQIEQWRNEIVTWRREVDEERAADRVILQQIVNDLKTLKRIGITLLISMVSGSAAITLAVLLSTKGR